MVSLELFFVVACAVSSQAWVLGGAKESDYHHARRFAHDLIRGRLSPELHERIQPHFIKEINAEIADGRRLVSANVTADQQLMIDWIATRGMPQTHVTVKLVEDPRAWTQEEIDALRTVLLGFNFPVEGDDPCGWRVDEPDPGCGVYCFNGAENAQYALLCEDGKWGGHISPEIGMLRGMRWIRWAGMALEGTVPPELTQLTELQYLELASNQITGDIPADWGNMVSLWHSVMMFNDLTGPIPELGALTELNLLCFGENPRLSGTLPASLGNLSKMTVLMLLGDDLTGPIPPEWSGMVSMQMLFLGPSGITGGLPPEVIGAMPNLFGAWVYGNPNLGGPLPLELCNSTLTIMVMFGNGFEGGFPPCLVNLTSTGLSQVSIGGNRLTGHFPDTSHLLGLSMILAAGNSFTSAGAVSPSVTKVDFRGNALTEFPPDWHSLPAVTELDISDNNISGWPDGPVSVRTAFSPTTVGRCGNPAPIRFEWPVIETVSVDNNPLHVEARHLLHSLGYMATLRELRATNCGLHSDIPLEMNFFIPDAPDFGFTGCGDRTPEQAGFRGLWKMDLSGNAITAINAPPPPALSSISLASNDLQEPLGPGWWGIDSTVLELDVSGNVQFKQLVAPPQSCPTSQADCPAGVECRVADDLRWQAISEEEGVECTQLCKIRGSQAVSPHHFAPESMCRCKSGYGGQNTSCTQCAADAFSRYVDDGLLASECEVCEPGRYRDSGKQQCMPCLAGSVTSVQGMEECELCAVGTYQSETGQDTCDECPTDQITSEWAIVAGAYKWVPVRGAQNASSCGCNQGFREVDGECVECGDSSITGLVCGGKDDVMVAAGFYAADDSFSVFKCHGAAGKCVGGEAGSTCAAGRRGTACAFCWEGYKSTDEGPCVPCDEGSSGKTTFALLSVAGCVAVVLAYVLIDRDLERRKSHTMLLVVIVFSMTVTLLQQLGIVGMFENVTWVEPIRRLLRFTELFLFDMELLNIECVASVDPVQKFTLQVCALGVALAMMLLTHCAITVVFHRAAFRERQNALLASVGTILLAFYISVVTAVLGPFQCMDNPNGKSTVRAYPSVVCWDSADHTTMVVIGILALQVPLGFYAYCFWSVVRYPSKMMKPRGANFLQTHKWLFFRYKPDAFWYSIVHMTRSLLLAMVPMLPNVAGQIVIMDVIMIAQLMIVAGTAPYRVSKANYLDNFFTVAILMTLICAAFYVEWSPGSALAWIATLLLMVCLLCLPILACAAFVVYLVSGKGNKEFKYFLCHHKVGAGAFTRLLKVQLKRSIGSGQNVFLDSDNLVDLDTLFDSVAFKTETMVFVSSSELLTRPWCMGEITTASRHGIPAVKLALADFSNPKDDFIDNYATIMGDRLSVLTKYSVSVDDAQDAIRWFRDLEGIEVPIGINDAALQEIASAIMPTGRISFKAKGTVKSTPANKPDASASSTVIIADPLNWEACSSAMILERMLVMYFVDRPQDMPRILGPGDELPTVTKQVLLICSGGVLESDDVLQRLISVTVKKLLISPVIVEDGFRFPTKSFAEEHRHQLSSLLAAEAGNEKVDEHLEAIRSIFAIIGMMFMAKTASDKVLEAVAGEIAARVSYLEKNTEPTSARGSGSSAADTGGARPSAAQQEPDEDEGNNSNVGASQDAGAEDEGANVEAV